MRRTVVLSAILCAAFSVAFGQKYYDPDMKQLFGSYGCSGCHGGSGGMTLTTYQQLMTTGFHQPVVVPFDSTSVIVLKLKPSPPFGSRMPFGGPYMTDADLSSVVQWIMEGAKESATSGVDSHDGLPPAEFALYQNRPNPFNPATTLSFSLPVRSRVALSVYNALGQEVATLVNGEMEAGVKEITFDATPLASGVYIYRLEAGAFVAARRMLLVK